MQYYVIGPDGAKYGPGDVPTLRVWAADNRLSPQTILQEVDTGYTVAAQQVLGIFDIQPTAQPRAPGPLNPEQQIYQNPPNMAPSYPRPPATNANDTLITVSWVCSGIGFLCCPIVLCLAGVICAVVAGAQGSKKFLAPLIFGICTLVGGFAINILLQPYLQELMKQLLQQRGAG